MGVIDGRVAIITGGARGIGASISRLFAREGASLVINDLGGNADGTGGDEGPAKQIADEISAAGGAAVADGGDIGDVATGERLVRTAVGQFGKLDIVVNVAGILRDRMIFNLSEQDWDAVIRVHLKGHYSTVRPASAYWREQRNPQGHYRVINFTTVSGLDGSPGQPNYAAAKMGIVGLTYSLAQGLARYGVTANAIAPGAATRLTATIPADKRVAREDRPADEDLERSPDNIAPVALYMASERSDWLTGRVVSSSGFEVGLYENPQIIRQLSAPEPWEFGRLAKAMEASFRPAADGLPHSLYARMLQVATTMLASGGEEALQMKELADRAEVSLATLYRYFPAKDHVLLAISYSRYENALRRVVSEAPHGDTVQERVTNHMMREFHAGQRDQLLTAALTKVLTDTRAEYRQVIAKVEHTHMQVLEHVATAGGPVSPELRQRLRIAGDVFGAATRRWLAGVSSAAQARFEIRMGCYLLNVPESRPVPVMASLSESGPA